ncbi:MAG TPA: SDR family oxidoreductase [Acidimicrobiales bacterium]
MAAGPLADQVALVTGAASGIGRAAAVALAGAGAEVALVDVDAARLRETAAEIAPLGVRALPCPTDLAEPTAITELVASVLAELGRIDVLVNSAGTTGGPHNVLSFSDESLDAVLAVNLRAPLLLTRAVGAHMVERGGGGRIVNVSSSAAFRSVSAPAIYAASKAGLNGLTRASAADLAPHDVNVNAVAPGMTMTPMTAGIGDEDAYRRVVSSGPLENLFHRPSTPEDVANVILFLCLPESRQITGQVIHTSAGQVV